MVVMDLPCMEATGMAQGLTACPSMMQVQALQTLMPQPYLGPVMPSLSRKTQSNAMPGGASTETFLPFTLKSNCGMVFSCVRGGLIEPTGLQRVGGAGN
jgi:hypothetical protein